VLAVINQQPIKTDRIRRIEGSFAFIEHRFLRHGFWTGLSHHALLLYFFLVLVADRRGLSFYGYDRICSLLGLILDDYIQARDELIDDDLIAFDGRVFQVLSLPESPRRKQSLPALAGRDDMSRHDPATIRQIITTTLRGDHAG
jgi:hypothetical protein